MSTPSLRHHLLRTLMLPIIAGIILVGAASSYGTYHEANEMYDAEQVHFAKILRALALSMPKPTTLDIEGVRRPGAYEKYLTFRVWKNGTLLLRSDNSGSFGPTPPAQGFTDISINGTGWHVYVEHAGEVTVEVAEENEVRLDLIRHVLAGIFLPQFIIFPVIGFIIWRGISRGLSPVEYLSQLVRRRDVAQLIPIPDQHVPQELTPMVYAINDLMQRVTDAMRIEKNFTNYAAHEMRTPIAALKTQAQVILRTRDAERQKELTGELLQTVSRTQRIIEQLLAYARVQHHVASVTPIDLSELVLEEIRHAIPRALDKQISIEPSVPEAIMVTGQHELLQLVISNLLDNAMKYIPKHSRIEVVLEQVGTATLLHIRDNGPGIKTNHLPHIFDPFYRITGATASGAGLGLAIVKWACDLQRIGISTQPGIGGAGVSFTLRFHES